MAMNIPLPPANFGGGLMQALIAGGRTKQAREQAAAQQSQFLQDLMLRQQQQQRLAEQFELEKQLFPFKMQAYQHEAALHPYQIQNLQAQIGAQQALAEQRSPDYQAQQLQHMLNALRGVQQGENDGVAGGVMGVPSQEMLMRAWMKKNFGVDINEETPSEKRSEEIIATGEKERAKQEEKFRAQNLEDLENTFNALGDVNQAKELLGDLTTNPQQYDYASSAMGPLDVYFPAVRPGTREFRGQFERLSNRMKANIARLEKGATSDKERAMFDKAEISMSDNWMTAMGKLKAQEYYLKQLLKRKNIIAENLTSGMSREEALRDAMMKTSIENVSGQNNSSVQKDELIYNPLTGELK